MSTNTNMSTQHTDEPKILIVDDNPENLRLLSIILKEKGYSIRQLREGKMVMQSVLNSPPDLILLDIMMPETDGYEVCRQLKAEELTCDIPVIFISALDETAEKVKAFSLGGTDYITKPFQEEEVLARVATHINLQKIQKQLKIQNIILQQEITERKQAEDERLHLQRRLQQAQKAESLGRMAGAVAHHFNNLLFMVSGNLELLKYDLPPQSKAMENLNDAEKATRRAVELGRLMLTYVGQDAGKSSLIDLSCEVSSALPLAEDSMPGNIRLHRELVSRLPAVKAGRDDIRRIVMNLVANAWEAMDGHAGTVGITTGTTSCDRTYLERAAWVESSEPGVYVYLEVSDDGCGMNDETIEQMFDPFFTTKFTGRGLGLASVAGIVRASRGAVSVSSRPNAGTVIRVLFPAAGDPIYSVKPVVTKTAESVKPTAGEPAHSVKTATEVAAPKIPAQGTVLLAEDEEPIRNVCKTMLERLGFKVLTAADGAEAVNIFQEKEKEITCILCDLSMPRMDGWETLHAIRKIRPSGTPLIFASGYDEATAMQGDHSILPDAFIHKPYQLTDLKVLLGKVLGEPSFTEKK